MKKSLKTKLVVAFCVIISISLLTLGISSYMYVSNSVQSIVEQDLSERGSEAASSTQETLNSINKYVEMLSIDERLAKVAAGDSSLNASAYSYLSELVKQNSGKMEMLAITDANCKEILNSKNENANIDLSSREYVQNALNGSSSQSDVIVSLTTKDTIIAIAYPLKLNGKIVGTIIGSVYFDNISRNISKLKTGEKGYSYMVDKSGLIVYHPDSKKVLKDNIMKMKNDKLSALFSKGKSSKAEGYYTSPSGNKEYAVFIPCGDWVIVSAANYNEYMAPVFDIRNVTIILIIICSIIAGLIAYFGIAVKLVKPIKILEGLMVKVGSGDLTIKADIKTQDELENLSDNFNKMISHQNGIIRNVRNHAEELTGSSEELSASSEEISAATQEIAANIESVAKNAKKQDELVIETSEVLVQLSSLVQIAQSKALTAKENSKVTMEAARNGRIKIENTSSAINNINESTIKTEKTLKTLDDISKKVSGIIDTINSISEQTNLLALNASIEAARAGEHGKGFMVVAGEVGKLSEQTSSEAKNISDLINEMMNQIQKAVSSMNSSKKAVENGVEVTNETDKSFISIIEAVEQIVNDIGKIVDVTNDEVASSDHIVKLIDSVATITEKTTSSSEQVAAAAEEEAATIQNITESAQQTSDMAISMDKAVEKFII